MRTPPYSTIRQLISFIDEPHRSACKKILRNEAETLKWAWGSTHNHQNWPGGYLDHVTETMNLAIALYGTLSACRPLPFPLSDALLVMFLHDIEKPWRFRYGPNGERENVPGMQTKAERKTFRERFLAEHGFTLTERQMNALTYVEGELDDYSPKRRVMNELAAFCHLCDVTSARIWHDCPREEDDPWTGAKRSIS